MHSFSKTLALAAFALFLSNPAWAETTHLSAQLSTAAEIPAKSGPGIGSVDAILDTASGKLKYTITYDGLSGRATAAHFHGPASASESAGVVVKITGDLTSPIEGEAMLTPEQANALMAGRWYVNIHTANNPSGEIRGQLMKK
ncbi:MAG: CHRD domain-containing protein [Betaproteobacteria bacterium]|nr:CHRD domain-containing protein [Betaproteobacteria bacterium]